MQVLSNLSNFGKSYGYLFKVKFWSFYHISNYQIWLNHMTPGANFRNLQLSPYLALNFRKKSLPPPPPKVFIGLRKLL